LRAASSGSGGAAGGSGGAAAGASGGGGCCGAFRFAPTDFIACTSGIKQYKTPPTKIKTTTKIFLNIPDYPLFYMYVR
jgi:hypothetical protein